MIVLSVLNTFAAAVGMALAAWIGLRLVRANAATRYWTWWAVLAALAVMLWWPRAVAPAVSSILAVPSPAAPIEVAPRVDWFAWIVLAWAMFAAFRLLRIALSYAHLRRIIRGARVANPSRLEALRTSHGVKRSTQLLVSDDVSGPISAGYLRASILMPEALLDRLTPAELDHVLLHELAHIARRDDWTKLAARFTGAILGLHPVAAFALARIEKEREHACDDWVATATGDPRAYAASLARVFELSRGRKEILASGMAGPKLGDRVSRLLASGRRFTRRVSIASVLAISAALAISVSIASQWPAWVVFAQDRLPISPAPSSPPNPSVRPPAPIAPVKRIPNPDSPVPERLMAGQCIGAGVECPGRQTVPFVIEPSAEERAARLRESTPVLDPLYTAMEEKRQALIAAQDPDRDAALHDYEQARQAYNEMVSKIVGPTVIRLILPSRAEMLKRMGEKQ